MENADFYSIIIKSSLDVFLSISMLQMIEPRYILKIEFLLVESKKVRVIHPISE
jgi:hypothetical protein